MGIDLAGGLADLASRRVELLAECMGARDQIRIHHSGEVPAVGLGVNSMTARHLDQLHIHMAGIQPQVQADLKKNEKSITRDPTKWKQSIVQVGAYKYRVLHLDN